MTSSSKTSSVDIGTITNDGSLSDFEVVERMHKLEERRQELQRERDREELKRDPDIRVKEYRAAHYICHPRCGFVCDRRDEAAIIDHKSTCSYQIERAQQDKQELQFQREGYSKMGYCLGMIERAKQDIKNMQRKIAREREEKQDNYEFVIQMSEAKIGETKTRLEKEQEEMQKLLNHENEITRSAARELYQKYLNASEYDRIRDRY